MKDPEEKELMAYFAGLIDGDGNIGIRKVKQKPLPLIQFHNSFKETSVYLKKIFGGTVAWDRPKNLKNRIIWKWMLQGQEGCRNFINKVGEHLITKRDSSIEMIEFFDNPDLEKNYYDSCKQLNLKRKLADFDFKGIERNLSEDKFFWAYAAGLMDTDGSFSIERSTRLPSKENRQLNTLVKYRPRILLTMVSGKAIEFILSNCSFGGYSIIKAPSALSGRAFRLSITARLDAIEFLKRCIPYLQIKAKQAISLLSFCRMYSPTNGLARIPEEEVEYRERCYKEMIMLNNTPSLGEKNGVSLGI